MPWVVEDTYGVKGDLGSHETGELRNPDFPSEVGATEPWSGSINATNVGASRDTFRIRVNGEARASFDLEPGGSRTAYFSGVGPSMFTIFLERSVVEVPWYKKYAKELMLVSVAGMVGIVIATKK